VTREGWLLKSFQMEFINGVKSELIGLPQGTITEIKIPFNDPVKQVRLAHFLSFCSAIVVILKSG